MTQDILPNLFRCNDTQFLENKRIFSGFWLFKMPACGGFWADSALLMLKQPLCRKQKSRS